MTLAAPPATRPRKRDVDRREALVDAVFRCVVRDGLASTTTAVVAEEAGVSKGVIHYYFRDKVALLEAGFQRVLDGFQDALERHPAAPGQPAREVESLIRLGLPLTEHSAERMQFWAEFMSPALTDLSLRALHRKYVDRWRGYIRQRVAAMKATGVLPPVSDPDAIATAILAFSDGLGLALLHRSTTDREAASAVRLFAESVATAGAGEGGSR